jgi:outer membrane lipoprotein carrier protein
MIKAFLFGICLALSLNARAEEDVDSFLQGLESLRAEFVQKLLDEQGRLVEESEGILELQRPGRFRWEYRAPYQQLIVADGREVWVYEADLAQATRKDYDNAIAGSPAQILTGVRPLREVFSVTRLDGDDTAYELLPQTPEAQFRSIRLGLIGTRLESLTLVDNLGQTTFIAFFAQERNLPLAPERFHFDPPPGTDIIDDRP